MELGELIQKERQLAEISVESLAESTDLSIGTIHAIEQGRRLPSVPSLKRLLRSLEIKGGEWVEPNMWLFEDRVYTLARFPGDTKAKKTRSERDSVDDLRTEVLRKILDADQTTLTYVNRLLQDS